MTREEFTERVGLNVSDGIFEVWNGVYMSSDKDKDEFCKPFATKKGHLDLSRSMVIEIAELKKKIRVQAESLHEWKSQMADFLLERAQKFGDITLHIKAADLIGMKEVIRRKIIKGLPLWEVDRVWLKNNLK